MDKHHLHLPLSASLQNILDHEAARERLTLNFLLDQTEGRGLYLVMVLLCLPFIAPVPLPGVSTVLGVVIILLSLRLSVELPPHLPKFIGDHSMSPEKMRKILRASVKLLKFIERLIRPRRTNWMTWQFARTGNALLITLMAFLMALPLPPIPPLTNLLPSYTIILLAVSMMEEDGVMIWIGYAAAAGTLIYFFFLTSFISTYLVKFFN